MQESLSSQSSEESEASHKAYESSEESAEEPEELPEAPDYPEPKLSGGLLPRDTSGFLTTGCMILKQIYLLLQSLDVNIKPV